MIAVLEHFLSIAILLLLHFCLVFLDFFSTEHVTDLLSDHNNRFESSFYTVFERLKEDVFGRLNLFGLFDKHLSPDIISRQKESHTEGSGSNFINFEFLFAFFLTKLHALNKFIDKGLLKSGYSFSFFLIQIMKFRPVILEPKWQQLQEDIFTRNSRLR